MKIIAFTGMPFSGKSVAVEIAKSTVFPVIRMGDLIWEEVKNQKLELNDENVGFVANSIRKKQGKDIWAKRTIEKIKSQNISDKIIVDGIRNIEEIDLFKKELSSNFVLIAITASDELRKKRAMSRNRIDDSKDIKSIEERDIREIGWGIKDVISNADIVVSNEQSIEDFRNKIKKILQKI
jgi:dephospho-CoA kinase